MKHLPNLLTLANLFCGCIAIAYILTAQPYLSLNVKDGMPNWQWIHGAEQMYMGSIFIGIAAICDMLDGMTARALKVFSPIGKDLDSLADVVSFGVAPSMILFKLLWDAQMGEKNAMDVSMIGMVPAFLIACFAALRLAKFNITSNEQKNYFIGMPVPAVGIFVGSLPLIMWYSPYHLVACFTDKGYAPTWVVNMCDVTVKIQGYVTGYMGSKWGIYLIIALLCWLMVSGVKFMKMTPSKWQLAHAWPQLVIILAALISIPFLQLMAIPFAFILYVVLSGLSPALSQGEGEVE